MILTGMSSVCFIHKLIVALESIIHYIIPFFILKLLAMKTFFINRILILGCLSLFTIEASAQAGTIQLKDSQGMRVNVKSYGDMKGDPYLTKDWSTASVKLQNGQTYEGVNVRYDLLEDQLTFKTAEGSELAFATPVSEFKITYDEKGSPVTKVFRSGFKGTTDNSFYEVLHDGNVKVLKKHGKQIETVQEYNSPPTKSITDRIKYFYVLNNELVELKKDTKSLGVVFGSKSAEVEKYIKENKLNVKKDEDLVKAFAYFSTL
jgi:hypothetical protein